jgi:hypothetical protein
LVVVMLGVSLVSRPSHASEPLTSGELLTVASRFNVDYQRNDDTAVWDRFDDASRRVITRSAYVTWHRECPVSTGSVSTTSASRLTAGWWLVDYSIDGVTLHDYWHQEHGQWRFSLVRSNPSAVALYSSSFAHFARSTGCAAS